MTQTRANPEKVAQAPVSRRMALQLAGVSAAAPFFAGAANAETSDAPSTPLVDTSSPQRQWAVREMRGLANLFMPSFQADMETLDPEGIRLDVQAAKTQGFFGTLPLTNWTPPGSAKWDLYQSTILDEAGDDFQVHGVTYNLDADDDIALIRKLEDMGVKALLLATKYPNDISAEDLYQAYKKRVEATDLPIILYAALGSGRAFPHLGPAGQPLEVFDRLADHPNVVAVKVSQPISLTSTVQICQTVADRVMVAPVNLDFYPLLSRHYHMQWSGQWNGEAVQTPDNQLGNRFLAACAERDFETIDAIAAEIQPVHDYFFRLQSDVIRIGAHPWQHNKYFAWLGGANGGLLPDDPRAPAGSVPTLTMSDREAIRAVFANSGLTPTDAPDEQFVVGRAAWERGVRPADLAVTPQYELG